MSLAPTSQLCLLYSEIIVKLSSFKLNGRPSYGIVKDEGLIDLGARLGSKYPDLKTLIGGEGIAEAQAIMANAAVDIRMDRVTFLPVIPNPSKILCVGLNYEEHRKETGAQPMQNVQPTLHPTIFTRHADTQVGHGVPILLPPESQKFDFEGEIAIIIGRGGRRIAQADAWQHIAGYSCYNDGSMRDWQFHTTQWTPGKNFAASGAFGPWMTTADEIKPGEALTLTTRLNGEVMQHANTDMLIFPIPRLIAYCSTFTPLTAGDVIVTGTPSGVGMARTPPVFMRDGDLIEVEVSRVGCLRNVVKEE